ncbi:hypothetical protein BGZ61DRAFT_359255 [Ilyonectria robusta]|uniref:uncharacterized protein n=1 Tax=Ilyonectria robusta TaxID=1079257 RepID=UPI001E8D53B0|nr:uncharacterized protein BGZ61DRAFT_359255 [Ilyonectria robusta]KAH8679497.1 hypothetical protein BGZ61DRAFT_359255 [Ilyonectria robusta]
MEGNDPDNLRVTAGTALNGQLVSSAEASGGKSADLVTVVDFDSSATVIYPLGDPAKADSSFSEIDSSGGTWIADGVTKGVEELTKSGHGTTKDRSGIVVLTDGEDSDVESLIDEINKAGSLGIRVSFGFLAPPDSFHEPTLLQAILQTGGTYMSFDQAENIQPWLYLLLGNGITALDKTSSTAQPLLSSITIAKLSGSGDVTFSYSASAGEKLVFTVTSLSEQDLAVKLSHENGDLVAKNSTPSGNEPAVLSVKTTKAETLKVVVSSATSEEGIFQISVNSSLGISGCTLDKSNPQNGSVPTPTPTPSVPPVTGGASKIVSYGMPIIMVALSLVLL